jgi:hypothetical protein
LQGRRPAAQLLAKQRLAAQVGPEYPVEMRQQLLTIRQQGLRYGCLAYAGQE